MYFKFSIFYKTHYFSSEKGSRTLPQTEDRTTLLKEGEPGGGGAGVQMGGTSDVVMPLWRRGRSLTSFVEVGPPYAEDDQITENLFNERFLLNI